MATYALQTQNWLQREKELSLLPTHGQSNVGSALSPMEQGSNQTFQITSSKMKVIYHSPALGDRARQTEVIRIWDQSDGWLSEKAYTSADPARPPSLIRPSHSRSRPPQLGGGRDPGFKQLIVMAS